MTVLERAASAEVVDDIVLPFSVESLSVRGCLVRLGPAIDQLLKRQDYPEAVSKLVAEAVTDEIRHGNHLHPVRAAEFD